MWSTRYLCTILMKPEFSRQIFEKKNNGLLNLNNPRSGSRDVQRRQTDRNDEAKSRFSQFCETHLNNILTLRRLNSIYTTHMD